MLHELNLILNDRESGSVALLNRLMSALELELRDSGLRAETFIDILMALRPKLKHFAAIENFLASLIFYARQKGAFPGKALQFIKDYRFYWQESAGKIAANFLEHFRPEGKTLLTHSHSHTVLSLLDQLHIKPIPFRVLQTLSIPGEEGRKSHERMCDLKLKADLIEDGKVKEALAYTDIILMGCDALLDKKFLNKIGTRTILEEARHFNIPTFLVTESRKEIIDSAWEKALTDLSLFEWVPLNLIDRILTEERD